jgi:hypothetical protein
VPEQHRDAAQRADRGLDRRATARQRDPADVRQHLRPDPAHGHGEDPDPRSNAAPDMYVTMGPGQV